jgi:hypothetical protein
MRTTTSWDSALYRGKLPTFQRHLNCINLQDSLECTDNALSLSTEFHNATTLGGSQDGGFENELQTFQRNLLPPPPRYRL